jgi:hypothetical protein
MGRVATKNTENVNTATRIDCVGCIFDLRLTEQAARGAGASIMDAHDRLHCAERGSINSSESRCVLQESVEQQRPEERGVTQTDAEMRSAFLSRIERFS